MKKESKIIFLALFILIINMLLISAFSIEDLQESIQIEGVDPGFIVLVIALLPAAILFIFSYIAVRRRNRSLIALQHLIWGIYFAYMLAKVYAFLDIYLNLGFLPRDLLTRLMPGNINEEVQSWYIIGIIINFVASIYMTFKNKNFVRNFMR